MSSVSIQLSHIGDTVWDQSRRRGLFVVPPSVIVARFGLCSAVLKRYSLALVGGRNPRRFAEFHARFGVDTDVLWSFAWARFGGGKTEARSPVSEPAVSNTRGRVTQVI